MTILYFIIAISILVTIHEFGHFLFAKRANIFADEFSIGFGPKLFGFKYGETEYKVCLLPFGGYVKILGQEPSAEVADNPRAFCNRSLWERFLVIVWGPLMNLLLCAVLMPIVFMLGRQIPVFLDQAPVVEQIQNSSPAAQYGFQAGDKVLELNNNTVNTWEDLLNQARVAGGENLQFIVQRGAETNVLNLPQLDAQTDMGIEPYLFYHSNPRVLAVNPGSPAEKAGLQVEDKLLRLNGEELINEGEFIRRINELGSNNVNLTIARNGVEQQISVTPEHNEKLQRWILGIQIGGDPMPSKFKRLGFIAALKEGAQEMWKLTSLLLDVLKKLVTFQLSTDAVGGPIMIAKSSAAAASAGLAPFLYFLAFLSLQLCILNLLPIPVLDGGHILFIFIEALFRRPVPHIVRQVANTLGAALLILLMVSVTLMDANREWQLMTKIMSWFHS